MNLRSLISFATNRATHSPVNSKSNKPTKVTESSIKTHVHNLTTNPNQIMINTATITFNMFSPKFIMNDKAKTKRIKSTSVTRAVNNKKSLALLSHLFYNKTDETTHQKYVSNICYTESSSKTKNNKTSFNKNNTIFTNYLESARPLYLHTENTASSGKSTLVRFVKKQSTEASNKKKQIKNEYFKSEHYTYKNKELSLALKSIRNKMKIKIAHHKKHPIDI